METIIRRMSAMLTCDRCGTKEEKMLTDKDRNLCSACAFHYSTAKVIGKQFGFLGEVVYRATENAKKEMFVPKKLKTVFSLLGAIGEAREERQREKIERKQERDARRKASMYRQANCFSCQKFITTDTHASCNTCRWLKCNCGACGCRYGYRYRY
jgi:hypothetical protein